MVNKAVAIGALMLSLLRRSIRQHTYLEAALACALFSILYLSRPTAPEAAYTVLHDSLPMYDMPFFAMNDSKFIRHTQLWT